MVENAEPCGHTRSRGERPLLGSGIDARREAQKLEPIGFDRGLRDICPDRDVEVVRFAVGTRPLCEGRKSSHSTAIPTPCQITHAVLETARRFNQLSTGL